MLEGAPELEAKALFRWLAETKHPGKYQEGQLRTFQRSIKRWRATEGPAKEVFFPQEHRAGEAMQTDFTVMDALGVTIQREPFLHQLCHSVLPYSNFQWATVCRSENGQALKKALQNHVLRLGRVPEWHQTDQSSTATHRADNRRVFNDDYVALVTHLGMKPRTIGVGKKEQNGDVESLNGALKRRIHQHLLLRRSRDFDSVEEYEAFLTRVLERANALRATKIAEELAVMKTLSVSRLPDYKGVKVGVSKQSTIRVNRNTYSVPSRLIGETVQARVFDDRIEVWYAQSRQLMVERLLGDNGARIDYRHVIWSLVRKPGAFLRYRHREALFPSLVFRRSYDRLQDAHGAGRTADIEYLRILHLAAATMEADVEVALELLLDTDDAWGADEVKAIAGADESVVVPELKDFEADLSDYDLLLSSAAQVSQ
jgi:transposase InsO family protein